MAVAATGSAVHGFEVDNHPCERLGIGKSRSPRLICSPSPDVKRDAAASRQFLLADFAHAAHAHRFIYTSQPSESPTFLPLTPYR